MNDGWTQGGAAATKGRKRSAHGTRGTHGSSVFRVFRVFRGPNGLEQDPRSKRSCSDIVLRIDTDAQTKPCRCVRILGGHRSVALRISNIGWFSPLYPCPFVSIRGFLLHGCSVDRLQLASSDCLCWDVSRVLLESSSNRARIVLDSISNPHWVNPLGNRVKVVEIWAGPTGSVH